MTKKLAFLSGAVLAFLLTACGGDSAAGPDTPDVASVSISPGPTVSLTVQTTTQLSATVKDAQGNVLNGRSVSWASMAGGIATVSQQGLVAAVSVGSAIIRATSEGKSSEVTVSVTAVPVASVTLSSTSATLVPNQVLSLSATARDAQGNVLDGRTMSWSTTASAVATVSNTGSVTAKAVGGTTITAATEGKSADATITVVDGGFVAPTGGQFTAASGRVVVEIPAGAVTAGLAVTVNPVAAPPQSASLVPGTAFEFGPNGTQFSQPVALRIRYETAQLPGGANPVQFRLHRWNGTAWTAIAGSTVDVPTRMVSGQTSSFSMYAIVEVPAPVATVTVDPGSAQMDVGATRALSATLRDASNNVLTGRTVTWTTSHPSIAGVSNTGVVTALAAGGPVTITATSEGRTGIATITVVSPLRLAILSAGSNHNCALTTDGEAWCWGYNLRGQLGDGSNTNRSIPVRVLGGHRFKAIAAGDEHTCAVTLQDATWCWGNNIHGGLGDGTNTNSTTPVRVNSAPELVSITSGGGHACGLTNAGAAFCWGRNVADFTTGDGLDGGQLGDGTPNNRNTAAPVIGSHTFTSMTAGYAFTCALASGGVPWCWGNNRFKQIGDGTGTHRFAPVLVSGGLSLVSLEAGIRHVCGLTSAGQAWCWGGNNSGELGDGNTFTERATPGMVLGNHVFQHISAGSSHTCALANGVPWCWGHNDRGPLGDGTLTRRPIPTLVSGNSRFVSIGTGTFHSCGLTAGGEAWCWGDNTFRQVGDGTPTQRLVPTRVSFPPG